MEKKDIKQLNKYKHNRSLDRDKGYEENKAGKAEREWHILHSVATGAYLRLCKVVNLIV